jgi:amino acid transporter
VVITLVITGLVNYKIFASVTDPLAFVFEQINMPKLGFFISVAAVIASTSVLLVFQIGQPRIWMNMSRDGLLPKKFAHINKNRTPGFATIVTGLFVGIPTLFIDELLMTDLTSIGTLFAFALVCAGVLMLAPNTSKSGFKLPYINSKWILPAIVLVFLFFYKERYLQVISNFYHAPTQDILLLIFGLLAVIVAIISFKRKLSLIPIAGFLSCMYLLIEIPVRSWFFFICWMLAGISIYALYGYRNSKLRLIKN